MKGRVDIEKKMVPCRTAKGFRKRFTRQKVHTKPGSGTCNLCSAPCSSCMHREYSHMGTKGNDFSDENCVATVTSQHTASEASNMPGVESSHDSLSENADSKASIKLSDVAVAPIKSETVSEDQLSPRYCNSDERAFSNNHREPKAEEGRDDNLSCVSRAKDVNASLVRDSRNIDNKNTSCSAAVVSSVGTEGSRRGRTETDGGEGLGEGIKCSNNVEQVERCNESMESLNSQELPVQSNSAEESEDSEMVEQDVKVCDICGDVGREDLLAICSRCSDGAEHIYCMRKMLRRVPQVDWLCEECKLAVETENHKQGSDAEVQRMRSNATMGRPGKRNAETSEVVSALKNRAIQLTFGQHKSFSAGGTATLSRECSLKSLDKGNGEPVSQTSLGKQTSNGQRVPTLKGTLLKSDSFNTVTSGMRGKLDEVSEKYRTVKDGSSLDVEGAVRMMGRSTSLKLANLGRSGVSESKLKMLSPNFSPLCDVKGLKRGKDTSLFERRKLYKMGRTSVNTVAMSSTADSKITPHGDGTLTSSTTNNKEPNAVRSDGKSSTLSRSTSNNPGKVRPSSVHGANNENAEQKVQISPKVETSSSSWTTEGTSNHLVANSKDSLSSSYKVHPGEKDLEHPKRSRLAAGLTCQSCKESGHTADDCKTSTRASGTVVPAARIPRDDISKGSKLKAAIEAAMLKKPRISWNKKEGDQSDGLSSSKMEVTCEATSRDQFAIVNKRKTMVSDEGMLKGKTNLETCFSDTKKMTSIDNMKEHVVQSADCFLPKSAGHLNSVVSSIREPYHASSISALVKMSVIPEHELVWQGSIELCRSGKFLDLHGGFQAHLSTGASPKVLEVVTKFPQKITLNELPRSSMWPRQFYDKPVNEDNIALYFFAKDVESYERSYKNLLEHMIKKDLALKANFEGVDLMVFPSTQLPVSCQRWNMLHFLWGVFRARKTNISDCSHVLAVPSLNVVSSVKEIPSGIVSKSQNPCSTEHVSKETSAQDISSDAHAGLNASDKPDISLNKDTSNSVLCTADSKSSSKLEIGNQSSAEARHSVPDREEPGLLEHRLDKGSCQPNGTNSAPSARPEAQAHGNSSASGEDSASYKIPNVSDQGLGLRGTVDLERIVDGQDSSSSMKIKVEMDLNEVVNIDAEDDQITEATDCFESNKRKWPQLEDGGSISKKPKSDFWEVDEPIGSRSGNSLQASLAPPMDPSSSFESTIAPGSYYFLVDSDHGKNLQVGGNSGLPRTEHSSEGVPNLNLALGAETDFPEKKILPFFLGTEKRNDDKQRLPYKSMEKEEEDGISASLSLSLSFRPQTRNEPGHREFSL